jgi:hypothetical protein
MNFWKSTCKKVKANGSKKQNKDIIIKKIEIWFKVFQKQNSQLNVFMRVRYENNYIFNLTSRIHSSFYLWVKHAKVEQKKILTHKQHNCMTSIYGGPLIYMCLCAGVCE